MSQMAQGGEQDINQAALNQKFQDIEEEEIEKALKKEQIWDNEGRSVNRQIEEKNKIINRKLFELYIYKLYENDIFIDHKRKKRYENSKKQKNDMQIMSQNYYQRNEQSDNNLFQYYQHLIKFQNTDPSDLKILINQNDLEPIEGFQIVFFYIKTMIKIFFWLPCLFYYICYYGLTKFSILFKLMVKNCFPLFYNQTIRNLRQANNSSSEQSTQIFTKNIIINQNGQDLSKFVKSTFGWFKSVSTYFVALVVINLYLISFILNFVGLAEIAYNPESYYLQIFGINFIIIFYIIMNGCTNILMNLQGNQLLFASEERELTKIMHDQQIKKKSFFMSFIIPPLDQNLKTAINLYSQAFYSQSQSKKMKNAIEFGQYASFYNEVLLDKLSFSCLGIFTQYLFISEKKASAELPYVANLGSSQQKRSSNKSLSLTKIFLFIYNNVFFPAILIILMITLTLHILEEQNYQINHGQRAILGSLWINLIVYILIQLNNRNIKKVLQSRLYALQRLNLMIQIDSNVNYCKTSKDLPTIDLFCTKSLQSWYDLRVLTMQYKIYSSYGWVNLILLELFLLVLEAVSQFYDSDGNFQYQLTKVNPYMRYLLLVGLIQRITTFIVPSLLQQARINEHYDQHLQILNSHLKKIKNIQATTDFTNFKPDFQEEQDILGQQNIIGNKMEIFNYKFRKNLRWEAFYHYLDRQNQIKSEKTNIQIQAKKQFIDDQNMYLDRLIRKYEEIIKLMEENPKIHQIYILGIQPINFQVLSVILTTIVSSLISFATDQLQANADSTCKFDQTS